MKKFYKARWLVDGYINTQQEKLTDKKIKEGIEELGAQIDFLEVYDFDDRLELAIQGAIIAFAFIEEQINKELDKRFGEA
mgnify:CR=1 FL=1